MKSTDLLKKTTLYSILLAIFYIFMPNISYAGYELRLKDAYLTFFMKIDDNRIVKFYNLPLEGDYFFDLNKASLIFTPKSSKNSYKINISPLEDGLPKAIFTRDTKNDDKVLLGYKTQFWRLSTKYKECKEIYSSKKLGEKVKFTITDIARINLAFAYLTGQDLSFPCSSHVISKAAGKLIGLPLHSYSLIDRSDFEVKAILENKELVSHKLPKDIKLLDNKNYAKYLETLLTNDAKNSYLQTVDLLGESGITKVKALKTLLKKPVNRRKIMPSK